MAAVFLFILIIGLITFIAAFGYRAIGALGSWWHYRKASIPASSIFLFVFGWVLAIDIAAGLMLIVVSQSVIIFIADAVYKKTVVDS